MPLNMTWPTRNSVHPASCTCAHCNPTLGSNSNVTAQMSYGRPDPVHSVHVDPLVVVGILCVVLVVLVLGTWGIVTVKRRCMGERGGDGVGV
jgi:hypothetical protein